MTETSTSERFPASHLLHSLRCAWVQVPDLEEAERLVTEGIGLARMGEGKVWDHWSTDLTGARWLLFGDEDEQVGRLCLVEGVARPDEPGLPRGLDSVELVVADVDRAAARIDTFPGVQRVGTTFTADLSELGGNQHRSALWRMPWGTHVIITAGLTPTPGRDFPSTRREAGRVFEVHVRTADHARGTALYAGALGLRSLMSATLTEGPIHQAWSIPDGRTVSMDLLKTGPEGTGLGAVELQAHDEASLQQGTEGGTAGLTFEAADLEAVRSALTEHGFDPSPVTPRSEGPLAGVPGFTVRGVEGEWLEVVEQGAGA
jgi:catechol 2,3-dioxygenase-like lactoylglutathione lyase family enzyme